MSEESIAELLIRILGDASGAVAAYGQTSKASEETKESIKGHGEEINKTYNELTKTLREVAAVIGVSLGVEAFKGFIERSMESVVQTSLLSDKLGIATERLAAIKIIAANTGVSFDSLSSSILRLQNSIAAANEGGETQQIIFARLGLSFEQLKNLKPDEAMVKIGQALNDVGDQYDRTHLQMQLFGRSGAELTNLLRAMSTGMEEAQKEADDLGLSFARVDGAKVQLAADAFDHIKLAIEAAGNQLVIALSGPLKEFADWITHQVLDIDNLRNNMSSLIDYIVVGIGYAGNVVQIFGIAWDGVKVSIGAVSTAIYGVLDLIVRGMVGAGEIVNNVFSIIRAGITLLSDAFTNPWDTFKASTAQLVVFVAEKFQALINVATEAARALDMQDTADKLASAMYTIGRAASDARVSLLSTVDPKVAKDAENLKSAIDNVWKTDVSSNEWVKKLDTLLGDAVSFTASSASDMSKDLRAPWSTEVIDEWLQHAKAAMDSAAKAKVLDDILEGEDQGDKKLTKYQLELQRLLKEQHAYLIKAKIEETDGYNNSVIQMKAAFAQEHTIKAEQDQILEDMKKQHEQRLNKISADAIFDEQGMFSKAAQDRVALAGGMAAQLTQLLEASNIKNVALLKASRIVETVINTAAAAMACFKAGSDEGGPYLGAAYAAIAVAYGAVQVAAIAGASSGGSVGGGAASVPAAIPPPHNAQGQTQAVTGAGQGGQMVNVSVAGSGLTTMGAREVLEALKNIIANGGPIAGLNT